MNERNVFGVAAKIKTPIALAALVALIVFSVASLVIKVLPTDRLLGEETTKIILVIVVALAVIALATLLSVIFLTGRPPRAHKTKIKTANDFSPGFVNGKFTYGNVPGLSSTRQTGRPGVPQGDVEVETKGNASPGIVGDDYTAQRNNG